MTDTELAALQARLRNAAEHRTLVAQPHAGIRDQATAELMGAAADAIAELGLLHSLVSDACRILEDAQTISETAEAHDDYSERMDTDVVGPSARWLADHAEARRA